MQLQVSNVEDIKATLLKEVSYCFASLECSDSVQTIRLSLDHPDIPAFPWLRAQKSTVKTYLSDRQDFLEMSGIGVADCIAGNENVDYETLLAKLNAVLKQATVDLKYFGGINFYLAPTDEPEWHAFGTYRFIVPRFELHRRSDRDYASLVCNIIIQPDTNPQTLEAGILAEIQDLNFSTDAKEAVLPELKSRHDLPDYQGWQKMVNKTFDHFKTKTLEKLVLARCTRLIFDEQLSPSALMGELKNINRDCYHFMLQTAADQAFVGATPEMLYYRKNNKLQTEAIAGTRRRGETERLDQVLASELLNSEKDRREHKYVMDSLLNSLQDLTLAIEASPRAELLKLTRLQHLHQSLKALLKDSVSDATLLDQLHPTPAVGGVPTSDAISVLSDIEPFNRGWYAGPVGWVGVDGAGFAVAIRSGLIHQNTLQVYAGAGIVEGSTAESEWQEIENKISGFLSLFE